MKVLVTGAKGQLGQVLMQTAPSDLQVIGLDKGTLNIADAAAVTATMESERPDIVINAAAYTAVDRAETEPALAMQINGEGVQNLALACKSSGARLIHVSTDFVFDGKRSTPYPPDAEPAPLGVYGHSKLAGERAAAEHDALIVRTGWLYSATGANFVQTILRLLRETQDVRVVTDQVGTPCFAPGLARAIWQLAENDARGLMHYADSGVASWYDFAVAVQEEAHAAGLLHSETVIEPVAASEFPTRAVRPAYSVLGKEKTWLHLGYKAPHWRVNLRQMFEETSRG